MKGAYRDLLGIENNHIFTKTFVVYDEEKLPRFKSIDEYVVSLPHTT